MYFQTSGRTIILYNASQGTVNQIVQDMQAGNKDFGDYKGSSNERVVVDWAQIIGLQIQRY